MKLTLKELLEQKALLQRHLDWIEHKIREVGSEAQEPGTATGEADATDEQHIEPLPEPIPPQPDKAEHDVDLAQYQGSPLTTADDAKRSCLYLMIGSFALFVLLLLLAYTFWPDSRPAQSATDTPEGQLQDDSRPSGWSFEPPAQGN